MKEEGGLRAHHSLLAVVGGMVSTPRDVVGLGCFLYSVGGEVGRVSLS